MKTKHLLYALACLWLSYGHGQNTVDQFAQFQGNWSVGIGVNVVADTGAGFETDISEKNNWNFGNPLQFTGEYFFNPYFSLASTLSFNKYKAGKIIDGNTIVPGQESNYVAFDLAGKYAFRTLIKSNVFDPYVFLGIGYTNIGGHQVQSDTGIIDRPTQDTMTGNLGFGLNLWFSQHWGANLNATAKFGLATQVTNHQQYSLGIVYLH